MSAEISQDQMDRYLDVALDGIKTGCASALASQGFHPADAVQAAESLRKSVVAQPLAIEALRESIRHRVLGTPFGGSALRVENVDHPGHPDHR